MTLADTSAAAGISEAASKAGIPLVYLNLEPENLDRLPEKQVYVGSKETRLGEGSSAEAACDLLKKIGKVSDAQAYILMGDLAHQASRDRTSSVKETLVQGDCKGVTIADEQSAAWTRTNAMDLTTNWVTAGRPIDVIFANNDEMAIGAIQALKAAGMSMDDVIVVGIYATQDALAAMAAGDLDVTVFQNAKGQSANAADAAVALARGKSVDRGGLGVPSNSCTPEKHGPVQPEELIPLTGAPALYAPVHLHLENAMDGIFIIGAGECAHPSSIRAARSRLFRIGHADREPSPICPMNGRQLSKPMSGAVQMKLICAKESLEAAGIDYLQGVSASKLDAGAGILNL